MSSDPSDSENPSSSAVRARPESSSSSSFENPSSSLSLDSPRSKSNVQESVQALKALASQPESFQMASSSRPMESSSSEEGPGGEVLIPFRKAPNTYILGPVCTERPLYPHITESFILPDGFRLPLTEEWFSLALRPKELRGWPKPNREYLQWLDRVSDQYGEEWKAWGIYDMIMLSKLSFSPNIDMFLTFLGFWNTSINAFVFPFGIMSPSLLDIAIMLGLPITGEDLSSLYDEAFEELGCSVSKENSAYSRYMEIHRQIDGGVSQTEHHAFLFFWLCKFFLCSKSLSMVNEFSYFLSAIISGRQVNLGALFLSSLYAGLKMWIVQLKARDNKAIPGPIWFLFLWIKEYFPEFYQEDSSPAEPVQDASSYSLRYKTISIPSSSAFTLAHRLFQMPPRSYLEIYPFLRYSYGPAWIHVDLLTASTEELAEVAPYWGSVLTSRDLLNGVRPKARASKLSAEPYNPNCFAQQFGLIQGIPAPYQSVIAPDDTRPELLPLEMKQLVITNNNKLSRFHFEPFCGESWGGPCLC